MPKVKRAKQVNSWSDVDPKVIKKFEEAVEKLLVAMVPVDCDGDSPLRVIIVNRMTHACPFIPVPLIDDRVPVGDERQELEEEAEKWLSCNLSVATDMLDKHLRLKRFFQQEAREKRKPLEVQITNACSACSKGIPCLPPSFVNREFPEGYPGRQHEGGIDCQAFELRRALWREKRKST
jgi:hypothetical protein